MLVSSVHVVGGSVYLLEVLVLLGGIHDGGGALGCLLVGGGDERANTTALDLAARLAAA